MKPAPKYRRIAEELLTEILAGHYDGVKRLPSETQLVKRFGASRPTVARALLELKTKGLLERRVGSGTYLSKANAEAAAPAQLGLIAPGLGKVEVFDIICGELASLARAHDLGMHWGGSTRPRADASVSLTEAEELCARYVEKKINGVFFIPFEFASDTETANRNVTERLSHAGIPVVLLDRDIRPFPHRSEFDLVGVDNFAGGFGLAEHLIRLGAHRLAFVARPFSAAAVDGRKAGVISALQAHGLETPRHLVHIGECTDPKFVTQLMAGRPYDAIICANDLTAAQLQQTLTRFGLKVPRQIRIVGFDDARFASLLSVPLTTMQQPCRDIAITAFQVMLERLKTPALPARNLLLTPRLIVRESCGAYPAALKSRGEI